jgi:hypothetical protein
MKSKAAASWIRSVFETAGVAIDGQVGDRRADVLAEFPEPQRPWGRGVAVEIQHKNSQKDRNAVQDDYASEGYSVCWLEQDDFDQRGVAIPLFGWVEHIEPVWPNAVPDKSEWSGTPLSDMVETETETVTDYAIIHPQWFEDELKRANERGLKLRNLRQKRVARKSVDAEMQAGVDAKRGRGGGGSVGRGCPACGSDNVCSVSEARSVFRVSKWGVREDQLQEATHICSFCKAVRLEDGGLWKRGQSINSRARELGQASSSKGRSEYRERLREGKLEI